MIFTVVKTWLSAQLKWIVLAGFVGSFAFGVWCRGVYADANELKLEQDYNKALETQAKENVKQLEKASAESLKRQKTIRFLSKELRKSHAKNPTAKCKLSPDSVRVIKAATKKPASR